MSQKDSSLAIEETVEENELFFPQLDLLIDHSEFKHSPKKVERTSPFYIEGRVTVSF